MKISNFACWLLGGWIAGSLFMILVATQNFRSVDRLLATPAGAAPQIERMGRDVHVVAGSERNLKITRPGDMQLAEFYLREERSAR